MARMTYTGNTENPQTIFIFRHRRIQATNLMKMRKQSGPSLLNVLLAPPASRSAFVQAIVFHGFQIKCGSEEYPPNRTMDDRRV
jgi:hypothetical protein